MKKRILVSFGLVLLVSMLLVSLAFAQDSTFTLNHAVIGAGGMGGTHSGYTIKSTLGQSVAGSFDMGSYGFTSGFWTQERLVIVEFSFFLPLISKQ
jgi:hypothetical protein